MGREGGSGGGNGQVCLCFLYSRLRFRFRLGLGNTDASNVILIKLYLEHRTPFAEYNLISMTNFGLVVNENLKIAVIEKNAGVLSFRHRKCPYS